MILLALCLLGCGDGGAADGAADGAGITGDTGSYAGTVPEHYDPELEEDEPGEPLSTDDLGLALDEVLDIVAKVEPNVIHDAWESTMDKWATDSCPELMEHNGQDYWRSDCVTEDGAHFSGWTLFFRAYELWMGDAWTEEHSWLSGHAFIDSPDGDRLESFGDVQYTYQRDFDDGHETWLGFVWGDFYWDSDGAQDTWLADEISLYLYYEHVLSGPDHSMWYDAEITGLDGAVVALVLDDLTLSSGAGGCGLEPVGTVRARDRDGRWTDTVFEGADDCDGCGLAFRDDEELGEVCVDWARLLEWEEAPW